jgi:hypothetical protein
MRPTGFSFQANLTHGHKVELVRPLTFEAGRCYAILAAILTQGSPWDAAGPVLGHVQLELREPPSQTSRGFVVARSTRPGPLEALKSNDRDWAAVIGGVETGCVKLEQTHAFVLSVEADGAQGVVFGEVFAR